MPQGTADELQEKLRRGDIDVAALIAAPERFGGLGPAAESMPLGALVSTGGHELGERAWRLMQTAPEAPLGSLDADHRAWIADLLKFWRRIPADVIQTVSPGDGMHAKTPDVYFKMGPVALRSVRLAMLETRKEGFERILDFACGYGRILRSLKAAFPQASLTACDIAREAVDFCAETFGATPVYADADPARISLEGGYDLIWVGSLFTHLSEPRWRTFLDLLESALAPGGLLLFTANGRFVRRQLVRQEWQDARGEPIWSSWGLDEEAVKEIVAGFDTEGFGYHDWGHGEGYGTSLSAPSWVCAQIERRPRLRISGFRETAWGRQDVVACNAIEV